MNELRISVSIEMGVMLDGGVVVSDIGRTCIARRLSTENA
jgi:hypothetical protein